MDIDAETATKYRQRARDVRQIASGMKDKTSRQILTGVAEDYERLAKTMDEIARSDSSRGVPNCTDSNGHAPRTD